tara:strand:+ start:937 stop:1389 length:453 start_codon:yes stop_codon:yes gene_type:complete
MIDSILKQLFLRETGKQSLVTQMKADSAALNALDYQTWCDSKRKFLHQEVADSHWIKTCTAGYVTEVHFLEDGSLIEHRLFDRYQTKGRWHIDQGCVMVEIEKEANRYTFAIVANDEINIHSAVEHKNGALHSYLKLAQVKEKHVNGNPN